MKFEWLVQKIYEHPDLSIGIFMVISLFIARLAFIQIRQAWKIFLSKKKRQSNGGGRLLYDVKSQNVAIFGQKSDFGDFSTSKNNTWVRRSAEKISA